MTTLTKDQITAVNEAAAHSTNVARYAARRAYAQIDAARDYFRLDDLAGLRNAFDDARNAAAAATDALAQAQTRVYNSAIWQHASVAQAHALSIALTTDARQHAKKAQDAARAVRRILTIADRRAQCYSARYN